MTDPLGNGSRFESRTSAGSLEQSAAPRGFHWLREGERRRYPDYRLPIAGQLVPYDERLEKGVNGLDK